MWAFRTGVYGEHHQSPPIVNDGTMFVTTGAHVVALDAATGDLVWRYERPLPEDLEKHHPTNRGVGLYEDKVYVGTLDAHVVALDAVSGAVVWERSIADYRLNYYVTMAPLVADGKVMVGTSGGEHGIRGFVVALDAQTGEEVWRRHTIPAPGEPGSETWPGDTWRTGAGPVWLTGHYDPALQLTYWGVGTPGPWMGDTRPGDNLYTNQPSRSMWTPASYAAITSITGTAHGTGTRRTRRCLWTSNVAGAPSPRSCMSVATATSGSSSGTPTASRFSRASPTCTTT